MAADGYLNFDTKINTSGFEKGTESISKVLATLDKSLKELATVIKSVSDIRFTADTSEAEKAVADVAESVENISDPEIKIEADTSQVENAAEQAKQAVESVEKATEDMPNPQLDTSPAVSELDRLEEKISVLQKALNQLSMPDSSLFDDNGEYINANAALKDYKRLEKLDSTRAKLDELEAKKKDLEKTAVINIEVESDTTQITATEDAVEEVGESAEKASEKIKSNIKDVDDTVDKSIDKNNININDALDKLKSQLKGIAAAVGIAFGVKEIVSFGKKAVESAAEINAANSQLEQTFGSLQTAAEEAMQRVADTSGIVATRLKGVGTSIYAFAKASGMDSVQALGMMEDALQVAADSAAYYDRSLEDTSESLKSFLKGNYANDAALGVSATETTRNTAANKLYGKSFQELSEAQKQLTLLQMVKDANDLSGATGQAAREADGWENVLGNLKETWKQLLAVIGQPMLKVAVSAVQELTAALSFLLEKAQIAVATLSELFGWELDNTASVTDNITQSVASQDDLTESVEETAKAQEKSVAGFDKINTLASDSASETKKNGGIDQISTPAGELPLTVKAETSGASKKLLSFIGSVKSTFLQLQGWLKQNFAPIFNNIWDGLVSESLELYSTIQQIFRDIQALGQPLAEYFQGDFTVMLQTTLAVIGEILIGLYDSFNMIFADIWGIAVYPALTDFVTIGLPLITEFCTEAINAFGVLFDEVKSLFDMLWEDAARPILGFISDVWHDLMVSLKKFWDKWGKPIFDKFCNAIVLTGDTLQTVWKSFLKPIFDTLMDVIDEIWTGHLRPLVDNFLDFVGVLIDGALDIYNDFIQPVVTWFVEKFGPPIAKSLSILAETVGSVIGNVIDIVSHIIDSLKGIVNFITGVFTLNWKKAWKGLKDYFEGIWNSFVDLVKIPINLIIGLVNGLIGAIESGLNLIIDGINTLSWDIPDWVPFVGGETFGFDFDNIDLPEIPHLAQGTVVPANYGNFLAVLGDNKREPEVVSPISSIKKAVAEAMAESGGNSPKEIILYTYLYPNSSAFHREVIKIVNSDKARKGG